MLTPSWFCNGMSLIYSCAVAKIVETISSHLSRAMRKPALCICENKEADQLRGNREADQRLCFRYIASTILPLPKSKISSLYPSSVTVQPGLCRTWPETPKTGFLTITTRLIFTLHSLRHSIYYENLLTYLLIAFQSHTLYKINEKGSLSLNLSLV